MNIFATSSCPVESATVLDDKRVVKMTLESAQMLSTAIYLNSGQQFSDIYRPTHVNHPCTLWCSASLENWKWLLNHVNALGREYTRRYGKVHKSEGIVNALIKYSSFVIEKKFTPFANCAESHLGSFKYLETSQAYREYLKLKWQHDKRTPTWYGRKVSLGSETLFQDVEKLCLSVVGSTSKETTST